MAGGSDRTPDKERHKGHTHKTQSTRRHHPNGAVSRHIDRGHISFFGAEFGQSARARAAPKSFLSVTPPRLASSACCPPQLSLLSSASACCPPPPPAALLARLARLARLAAVPRSQAVAARRRRPPARFPARRRARRFAVVGARVLARTQMAGAMDVEAPQAAANQRVADPLARSVEKSFNAFLATYVTAPKHDAESDAQTVHGQSRDSPCLRARTLLERHAQPRDRARHRFKPDNVEEPTYVTQLRIMRNDNHTTLYVDFAHVSAFSIVLAERIVTEFYRCAPLPPRTARVRKHRFPWWCSSAATAWRARGRARAQLRAGVALRAAGVCQDSYGGLCARGPVDLSRLFRGLLRPAGGAKVRDGWDHRVALLMSSDVDALCASPALACACAAAQDPRP